MPFETPLYSAALIAYLALGANFLGTGLLLLIHPGSRGVRWHAAFSFWIMAWLALQGWAALGHTDRALLLAYGWVVHLMPAFFFAAALVETHDVRNRVALAVVVLGLVTAPWLNPLTAGRLAILWQATMWGVPAVLYFGFRRARESDARPESPGKLALSLTLFVIVPVGVIGVIALRGAFLIYAMPLITVLIQFLIFHGVVHHRFYDIEVRAARSGDLATRAAEQERLALLGELSAMLAHEIRNPLAGMRSLTQRLGEPGLDTDKRTRYTDVILGEIGRLDRIVGNLLDAARRSTPNAMPDVEVPIAPLLDDILLLVDARARRAGITLHREPTHLSATAPRDALAQALLNLVLNAIAHTPAGGRVELGARTVADGIAIDVRDTGPGVPEDARAHIFEPFHTRGLGAGLGLAVVRRIVRERGWKVAVGDATGGGAIFTLQVPRHPFVPGSVEHPPDATAAATERPETATGVGGARP